MPGAGDAIWNKHLRLSWGGTLGDPAVEVWSNTIRLHYGGLAGIEYDLPDRADLQVMCDDVSGAIGDWVNNLSAYISNAVKLTWVKLNAIEANGKQRDVNTVLHDVAPPRVGNQGNTAPFHHTFALTLRTGIKRGRAHSGRIFPPIAGPPAQGTQTPYCSVNEATGMATAFAACLGSIQDRIDSHSAPTDVNRIHAIIASPGSVSAGTAPINYDITGVTCDRVADVQHRRSRSVPRVEVPLVAIPRA